MSSGGEITILDTHTTQPSRALSSTFCVCRMVEISHPVVYVVGHPCRMKLRTLGSVSAHLLILEALAAVADKQFKSCTRSSGRQSLSVVSVFGSWLYASAFPRSCPASATVLYQRHSRNRPPSKSKFKQASNHKASTAISPCHRCLGNHLSLTCKFKQVEHHKCHKKVT